MRVGLPLAGRLVSPGWHEVGRFLGAEHPRLLASAGREPRLLDAWREAGIADVRARRLSSAAGSSSGAAARDGARAAGVLRARAGRLARLRHAPPPAVHALAPAYVAIGAALAPRMDWRAARLDDARVRARDGGRRARARRAARPAAADAHPGRASSSRSPRCRSRAPARSASAPRSSRTLVAARVRGRRRVPRRRLQPRAVRRAPSTATSGSPSPGARSRC